MILLCLAVSGAQAADGCAEKAHQFDFWIGDWDVVANGKKVTAGQPIARMGKMFTSAMLHLEMYSGEASGPLTQRNQAPSKKFGANTPFQRRKDLIDPTPFLDKWKTNLPS